MALHKQFFICLLGLAFCGAGYCAGSRSGMTRERVSSSTGSQIYLISAPSIAVGDFSALPGINLELAGRVMREVPLHLTADLGFYFFSGYNFAMVVPILLGMDYVFNIAGSKLHPLFGVNLGPVIGPRVVFGMFFRPGLNVEIARGLDLNFEPRLGVLAGSFVFAPQFGARFLL